MARAASFASGTPVAFDTKGTVREARGLTSSTYTVSPLYRELRVHEPDDAEGLRHGAHLVPELRDALGRQRERQAASRPSPPECTPASSMCSMTPPTMTAPSASRMASTSTSTASFRKRSSSTGESFDTLTRVRHCSATALLLLAHDLHGATAEHVARAHPPSG